MLMSEHDHEYKYEITVRKHLPSVRQYVPADMISATARWNIGEGLDFNEIFRGLNQATEQAMREWLNPAMTMTAQAVQKTELASTYNSLKPPTEAEIDRLPWRPYHEGHSAGWIFRNLENPTAKQLNAYLEAEEKLPVTIGKHCYRFSGPEDNPHMFLSRAPVEKT